MSDEREKNKILIVGFDVYGAFMYPHLKCVIDELNHYSIVDYSTFRERGAFEPIRKTTNIKVGAKQLYSFLKIIRNTFIDSILVFKKLKAYNTIIAIDYYAYIVIACMLYFYQGKKVVFWSHDIIVEANPKFSNPFYRGFLKYVKIFLGKYKKIIIQDSERLSMLCMTYGVERNKDNDVFFLPVSLNKLPDAIEKLHVAIERDVSRKPVLLQCGLIHSLRMSDKVLSIYQKEHTEYTLAFHGYLSAAFCELLKTVKKRPIISSSLVKSEEIYRIVSECDIGLIAYAYGIEEKNFFFIQNASGQMVEFLRVAKPIIVIGEETNLAKLVLHEKIGVCVDGEDGLKEAVSEVVRNYRFYSENAYACFHKHYNIKNYIKDLSQWIQI